ncbi:hypothetical protein LV178_24685, partial [Burkholderia mallei]|nr:hypothetical protein [Burkholderia mallei]
AGHGRPDDRPAPAPDGAPAGLPAIVERARLRVEPFDARRTSPSRESIRLPNRSRFAWHSSKRRMLHAR